MADNDPWKEAKALMGRAFLSGLRRGMTKAEGPPVVPAPREIEEGPLEGLDPWVLLGDMADELSQEGRAAMVLLLRGLWERTVTRYGPSTPDGADEAPYYGQVLSFVEELQNLIEEQEGGTSNGK